jgi:protoheme IX farnesyltransferase
LLLLGGLMVGLGANSLAASVALATWFIYCWVYTPMKVLTWWNTAVGTLPGALPVMIGWTAAGGGLWDFEGWALTAIVILWQFPHFMSIAWLYREQYSQAGFQMLTRLDPTGIWAAWHAVIPAIVLIPLSVWVLQPTGWVTWPVALLGAAAAATQVAASVRFLRSRDDRTARKLLHASLIFLPAIMLLAVVRWVLL